MAVQVDIKGHVTIAVTDDPDKAKSLVLIAFDRAFPAGSDLEVSVAASTEVEGQLELPFPE